MALGLRNERYVEPDENYDNLRRMHITATP